MKYTLGALVTISIWTEVEAETTEEALEIATSRSMQGFCHQCASGEPGTCWSISGELDGVATDIKLDRFCS